MPHTAADLIDWMQGFMVTAGPLEGQPFKLWQWQREYLTAAFASEDVVECAVSVPCGIGKSTLEALVAVATLPGQPLHQRRSDTVIVASRHKQAREIFDHFEAFGSQLFDFSDRSEWRRSYSDNNLELTHNETRARVRCIGSDPSGAHSLAPTLAIADECSQWKPTQGERMIAALRSRAGKMAGFRLHAISTRPRDGSHWFQQMLDGAADYALTLSAPAELDPFDPATWRVAVPELDEMPVMRSTYERESSAMAGHADKEAMFRSLRLNQGGSETGESYALTQNEIRLCETDDDDVPERGGYVLGFDASQSRDWTGVVAVWQTGDVRYFAVLPSAKSLDERSRSDGVPYSEFAARGDLMQIGNRTVDLSAALGEAVSRWGEPVAVVYDNYRKPTLEDALDKRLPRPERIVRRFGEYDGGEDLGNMRLHAREGRLKWPRSRIARYTWSKARTQFGAQNGNEYLAKAGARQIGDDIALAMILATSEAHRRWWSKPKRKRMRYVGVTARR